MLHHLPLICRRAIAALAILLVLVTGTGLHVHGPAQHDHHAVNDGHHHGDGHHHHHHGEEVPAAPVDGDDPDLGNDDLVLHAHGSLVIASEADVLIADIHEAPPAAVRHRVDHGRAPERLARDIDPPPNKRVL